MRFFLQQFNNLRPFDSRRDYFPFAALFQILEEKITETLNWDSSGIALFHTGLKVATMKNVTRKNELVFLVVVGRKCTQFHSWVCECLALCRMAQISFHFFYYSSIHFISFDANQCHKIVIVRFILNGVVVWLCIHIFFGGSPLFRMATHVPCCLTNVWKCGDMSILICTRLRLLLCVFGSVISFRVFNIIIQYSSATK